MGGNSNAIPKNAEETMTEGHKQAMRTLAELGVDLQALLPCPDKSSQGRRMFLDQRAADESLELRQAYVAGWSAAVSRMVRTYLDRTGGSIFDTVLTYDADVLVCAQCGQEYEVRDDGRAYHRRSEMAGDVAEELDAHHTPYTDYNAD